MSISAINSYKNIIKAGRTLFKKSVKSAKVKLPQQKADSFERQCICEYKRFEINTPGLFDNTMEPEEYMVHENGLMRMLPEYFVTKIKSFKKGDGTKAIKDVVRKSLEDPTTQGRVALYATTLEENYIHLKPHPAGFYYKLGFRFSIPEYNIPFEKWLQEGGAKKLAPRKDGIMYLPKINIEHCLKY